MNKNRNIKSGSLLLLIAFMAAFSGCASSDPASAGSDEKISAEELKNTIWLGPICGMPSEGQYANEGFFLAEDGSLLFVNIFSMTGDSWTLDGNKLNLSSHTERYPDPQTIIYQLKKTDGIAHVSPVEGDSEMIQPSAQKLIPQIPEGRWLISTMLNPENAAIDPERPAYLEVIKNEDGSIDLQGNGSVNNYRAVLQFDTFNWETGPIMRTLMAGPALAYEDLFMQNLEQINSFLYLDDFLFLYQGTELILVMEMDKT